MQPWVFLNPEAQSTARLFEQRLTGSEFSPLLDAFHSSFPASVDKYTSEPHEFNREYPRRTGDDDDRLDRCICHVNGLRHNVQHRLDEPSICGDSAETECAGDAPYYHPEDHGDNLLRGTNGPIFNLPPEVSDLILSYLSPAALDGARHTCKEWWTRILSNTWVLSSVLGVKEAGSPLDGSLSGKLSHRDLLKKLDCDSDLPSTCQHPDAWRTRFRTRELEFSIPSPSSTLTKSAFIAAARTGVQNGFLVFQLQGSAKGTRDRLQSIVVIYRFDSAELPWYAGTIYDVKGQGALRITDVIEIRRHAEWVLKIEIGGTAGFYSLSTRKAFSKSDCRFSLERLESMEKLPGLSNYKLETQGFHTPPKHFLSGDQFWNILAPFPPIKGVCASPFSLRLIIQLLALQC